MTLIVTWLWQGLAIAWITAAAVRTMPRLSAATRYAIWWLALGAVLAIPAAHGLAGISTAVPPAPGLTPPDINGVDATGTLMLTAIPAAVVACAAALWSMTAAVGLLGIAKSCRALGRLKRTSSPFDRSREARLPLWIAARDDDGGDYRTHRAAELRTSDCLTGACALGLGRPAILVSRSVADALSDESLDEIVMHEQAHLDRYDDWSQLLLAIIVSLAGLHPAVRFLARRLEIDREAACDDRVVSTTGATRRYAGSLLAVAAVSNREAAGAELAAGVLTATTTVSALQVRVRRLLDPRRDRSARLASATSLVTMTALALAVVISTQLAPVVIFVEAAGGNALQGPAAAVAPTPEMPRAPAPLLDTNVTSAASAFKRPPPRTRTVVKRATRSERLVQAVDPPPGNASDAPPAPPAITAADPVPPLRAVPLPSWQPAATASAPTDAGAGWQTVKTSAIDAAGDLARAAAATGARARKTGVSIGHFVTRASKAGASVF